LNDSRLKQLSQGWIAVTPTQEQSKTIYHWTEKQAKYEAPLPAVSSDSWSRFEDFLVARETKASQTKH
jgi:hypothetical protein